MFTKRFTAKHLQESVVDAMQRMPLSVLLSVLGFGIICVQIALDDMLSNTAENILAKSFITVVMMFILSVAVYFYGEVRQRRKIHIWAYQTFTIAFGALFYASFEENLFDGFLTEGFVYIILTFICIMSALFIAPFIYNIFRRKRVSQREFYIFSYHIVFTIAMALIVGGVATLLGLIALWSIETLFNIHVGNMYSYWSAFALCIFAPLFFLVQAPSVNINSAEKVEDQKFYGFLIKYIGIPAIIFYFVILYLYSIKVLVNFSQWPQGEVAWMVIGFSFFGYLVYTACYIFENDFRFVKIFRQWIPYAIVPQVAMLFYAIGLRINQYDWTINRYFVVAFGVWLLFISLYFIFSQKKYLGAIPMSLMVCIIIISIGPWSVYNYPKIRQIENLYNNLNKAKMIEGELGMHAILPNNTYSDISARLSGEIYSGIEYLCDNHGCDSLNALFASEILKIKSKDREEWDILQERQKEREGMFASATKDDYVYVDSSEYTEMSNWEIIDELAKLLKVRPYYDNYNEIEYKTFGTGIYGSYTIKVTGYDYYVPLDYAPRVLYASNNLENNGKPFNQKYTSAINVKDGKLIIQSNDRGMQNQNFDIKNELEKIISGDMEAFTFEVQNNIMQVKVVINELTVNISENKETGKSQFGFERENASGYLLIKEL